MIPSQPETAMVDYRERQKKLMAETVADELSHHDWTYRAVRPIEMPPRPWHAGEKVEGDCSKGCQFIDWWSGSPRDPMGMGWGGYGNSQTLWQHCQHLDHPSELLVGDFVTFGVDGEDHATKVYEEGADPLLWSFGHEGAPNFYRLSQDRRPSQYLRNPLPIPKQTPAERCRARTGWFAWVQWRRGRGDWSGYGKKNRSVRPNVPRRVPASWWVRYAKLLARQRHGNTSSAQTPRTA